MGKWEFWEKTPSLFPLSLAISKSSTLARSHAIWKKVAIVIPPLFPFMQLS